MEDYKDYLGGEGLLDERNRLLPIFPCGASFPENERFHLYYEPQAGPVRATTASLASTRTRQSG